MLSAFRLLRRYCSGKQVLSLVFATALMSVQCTTYHVMLGGVSHHFTREFRGKPYNEIHHTVGFGGRNEFAKGAVGWSAQYMKNSFNNDAFYLTGQLGFRNITLGRFTNTTGFLMGVATGYADRFGMRSESPIPLAGFANDMCLYDFCLYQVLLPSYEGMSGLVFVGAKYDFRL